MKDENDEIKHIDKKYVLAYGYRRFLSCKKLGHTIIPALIHTSEKDNVIADVSIEDIDVVDNSRLRVEEGELTELMQSIKQNGLLQPVGVWPTDKLEEKDFLVLNLTENIHRKDITPFELAKACKTLKNLGLNDNEIAVRLSIPVSRVKRLFDTMGALSEKWVKKTEFVQSGNRAHTGISLTAANAIGVLRIPKHEKERLIEEAFKQHLNAYDIRIIKVLMQSGMTLEQSIKHRNKYTVRSVDVPVITAEWDKVSKTINVSFTEFVKRVLGGKLKPIPSVLMS